MHARKSYAQPGSSWQEPIIIDDQTSEEDDQGKQGLPSALPPEQSPKQSAYSYRDPLSADIIYKIVWSDRDNYLDTLNGYWYFTITQNIHRKRQLTGWYCVITFHWHDVRAEIECIYYPSMKFFDDFKPVGGSLRRGSERVKDVQISMWNFAKRGPGVNPRHTVDDDNANRIMFATMTMDDGSLVRLHGKMVREGEAIDGVYFSRDERRMLRLRS